MNRCNRFHRGAAIRMRFFELLNHVQRFLGRSRLVTRLAVAVRNQCNCVIGYSVTQTPASKENGEQWLAQLVAPTCKRFVDVGANVGCWTAQLLTTAPPDAIGLLFEPSTEAIERLTKRFNAEIRVEVVPAACRRPARPARVRGRAGRRRNIIAGSRRR